MSTSTDTGISVGHIEDVEVIPVMPGVSTGKALELDNVSVHVVDLAPGVKIKDPHDGYKELHLVWNGDAELVDGQPPLGPGSLVLADAGTTHHPGSRSGGRVLIVRIKACDTCGRGEAAA